MDYILMTHTCTDCERKTCMKQGCEIMNQERTDQIKSITARLEMAADKRGGDATNDWYRMMHRLSAVIDIYLIEQEIYHE